VLKDIKVVNQLNKLVVFPVFKNM